MKYSDNVEYKGMFKYGGIKHGNGVFISQYGTYTGQFVNDLPNTDIDNSYGVMVYPNNAVYEGQWKDGKRHGYGRYAYYHGDSYEGDWIDDVAIGLGLVIFADGTQYDGNFGSSFKFGNKAIHKW